MKNWSTLEADVTRIMNKHFTPGRGGRRIDKIVVHHNAGMLSIDDIWNVWQSREASAHYQVESGGRIGQLVWDRDTAWHAANASVNATSIGIEVSNSAGPPHWPISGTAVEETAHLIAAICRYYKLGPPTAGRNVRFHKEFAATGCPGQLAPGGPLHDQMMSRATHWYRQMETPASATPATPPPKENAMSTDDLILDQLAGPHRGAGPWPGWPQLGGRTMVDALAAIGEKLGVDGMRAPGVHRADG